MKKIHHINIMVPNLEEAVSYYTDVLGYTEEVRFVGGMTFVFLSDGVTTYEILEDVTLEKAVFDHIAYESEDIESDYAYYNKLGVTITEVGNITYLFENGVKYFFIKGAAGERLEFCQRL